MGVNGIYGLSGSGLDIESMVKVGMMSKQNQYDKLQQTYTLNEWKKEAFLDVYDKLNTYNISTLSDFKMSGNMNARTAVSSSDKISVTADASAPAMTHKITVESTATNAYLVGTGHLQRGSTDNVAASSTSTLIKDSLFKSIETTKDGNGNVTGYTLTNWDDTTINLDTIEKDKNGKITAIKENNGNETALSFVIGDGSNTGVVTTGKTNVINASITGPVDQSGTSFTVNIAELGTAASDSYTNIAFNDAKSLFRSAIAETYKWNSVTDVTLSADGKTFTVSGTTVTTGILGTGTETETNTATIAASETALKFSVEVGNDTKNIDITYGDIAKIITDPGSTLNDLVTVLNKKFADEGIDAKASFDSSTGALSFSTFDSKVTKIQLTNEEESSAIGRALIKKLYDSSSDKNELKKFEMGGPDAEIPQALKFALSGTIKDAQGTITLDGGTPQNLTFSGNTATYNGITIEALKADSDTVTAKPTNPVIYSYKDILDGGKTLYDLASDIGNKGTNVRATYDGVNDTFSLYNLKSGESNSIVVAAQNSQTANLLNGMGLKQVKGGEDLSDTKAVTFADKKATTISGTNASVLIDGVKYEDIDSNKLKVNGVTYNFGNVTEKTSATVTVDQDVSKIVDNVKSFVESYNKLLSELYDVYNEKPNSSFKPLTDAQRAEMNEEQIKKWEEKAKSGMLYHDSNIRKIIDNLRGAISSNVDSVNTDYNNAYSIGISTTGIYGQLVLDEDKLKNALNQDPDSVYNVFAKLDSTTTEANSAYKTSDGIAQRIGDIMNNGLKSIATVAGRNSDINEDSQLNTLLRNLQTRMSSFRSMMNAFEDSLYKKYDAMESTLAMLGTQLNYVTSSFA